MAVPLSVCSLTFFLAAVFCRLLLLMDCLTAAAASVTPICCMTSLLRSMRCCRCISISGSPGWGAGRYALGVCCCSCSALASAAAALRFLPLLAGAADSAAVAGGDILATLKCSPMARLLPVQLCSTLCTKLTMVPCAGLDGQQTDGGKRGQSNS